MADAVGIVDVASEQARRPRAEGQRQDRRGVRGEARRQRLVDDDDAARRDVVGARPSPLGARFCAICA